MKMTELRKYAGRTDLRLDELLAVANDLITMVAPVQPSERVAETVNERALRYYISEGLIDKPSDREGNAALYSYRHLLQILAIKRLQASYLPVRRIREIVPESSNQKLEEIIYGGNAKEVTAAKSSALEYLTSISPENDRVSEQSRMFHPEPLALSCPPNVFMESSYSRPPATESWERHVIEDGIEIHIRSDRKGNLRKGELRRIVERFLKLIGS